MRITGTFNRGAILSSKNQITIPVWARERLHLRPGDRVRLTIEEHRVIMTAEGPDDTRYPPEQELSELLFLMGNLLSRAGRLLDRMYPELLH